MSKSSNQPKSSGNPEQVFEIALIAAEKRFRETLNAIYLEEHECHLSVHIARVTGKSKAWVSGIQNHPKRVTKKNVQFLLKSIRRVENQHALVEAWREINTLLQATEHLDHSELTTQGLSDLATRFGMRNRPDIGLNILQPIKVDEIELEVAEGVLTTQCYLALHLRDHAVVWNAVAKLIELGEEKQSYRLKIRGYRWKSHLIRHHYRLPMSSSSVKQALNNLDTFEGAIEMSKSLGQITDKQKNNFHFALTKETLLLQASLCKQDDENMRSHLKKQAEALEKFIGLEDQKFWNTSVYELQARLFIVVGELGKAEQIILDHLKPEAKSLSEIRLRYILMAAKLYRAKGEKENALHCAELLMKDAQPRRDLFHHEEGLKEWSILRGLVFPPSHPVF